MFSKIFDELDLSSTTQRVFGDLLEKGPSTARQIAERLDIPRPSVYDNIKILSQQGLVTERNEENKKVFCIDDIQNIPELLQTKINSLQSEKDHIEKLIPSLLHHIDFIEPKIKFYSGKEGVKQVLNHIMLHHDIETVLMWPMNEITKIFGKEYLTELNTKRIKRNISIRGIWPLDQKISFKEYPFLGVGGRHQREIRCAPKGMTWKMGYWMYEDKVAFLSSEKEGFGFVVHSKDFTELLKAQFETIWKISKPIKPEPHHTDHFLRSIGEI